MDSTPTLSVIIPLYREGSHILESLKVIQTHLDALEKTYEFVLVDDGSPDNTWEEIEKFAMDRPWVCGIGFSRNFGKEAAMRAGLEHARGHAAIIMDGDLQHPPSLIATMVRLWEQDGYDVVDTVKATRQHEPIFYRKMAQLFNFLMCKLSGFNLAGASDFKLLDRKVVNELIRFDEARTFYRGLTEWLGFRHIRLPMHVERRTAGASGWSILRLIHLAVTALTSFSAIMLHAMTVMGMIFIGITAISAIYTLGVWLKGGAVKGFTTVILLQLFIGGIIMFGQGIIGEYLANIYWETKRRPRYIVRRLISKDESCPRVLNSSE